MRSRRHSTPLRWAILDLDGTLKSARDPYVYLHERLGTAERADAWLEDGLSGRISYEEWLCRDVSLWRGQSVRHLEELLRRNRYLPGARELVGELRSRGVRMAILSTGPDIHAKLVARELGIERVVANEVVVRDGVVTGEIGRYVALGGKGPAAQEILSDWGADPSACLALGDGESDVAMFDLVGVAVGVRPQSRAVREALDIVIEEPDLSGLLQALQDLDANLLPPRRGRP